MDAAHDADFDDKGETDMKIDFSGKVAIVTGAGGGIGRAVSLALSQAGAKVAVVDGEWATVGSSNLDPLSLLMAREANVMVRDAAFATVLRASLEQAMVRGGQQVDAQVFAARPRTQRAKEWVAYAIMRFGLLLLGRRY